MSQILGWKGKFALGVRGLRTDFTNFHLLHYRNIDGFLITGKNSGTHWLKCMLSYAFAREFGFPPPAYTSGRGADDFISHPKWPQKYPTLPHIGYSHNIPSAFLTGPGARKALGLPPIVVLVRAIPEAMLSHWVKWGELKNLSLSDYVRSPPPGRRDIADVWWYLEFYNRWGRAAEVCPRDILIVRYEDLSRDPTFWLNRIASHYGIALSPGAVAAALERSDREFVRSRLDPEYGEAIVPDPARRTGVKFSRADWDYLRNILNDHLDYDFGYGLGKYRGQEEPVARAQRI